MHLWECRANARSRFINADILKCDRCRQPKLDPYKYRPRLAISIHWLPHGNDIDFLAIRGFLTRKTLSLAVPMTYVYDDLRRGINRGVTMGHGRSYVLRHAMFAAIFQRILFSRFPCERDTAPESRSE